MAKNGADLTRYYDASEVVQTLNDVGEGEYTGRSTLHSSTLLHRALRISIDRCIENGGFNKANWIGLHSSDITIRPADKFYKGLTGKYVATFERLVWAGTLQNKNFLSFFHQEVLKKFFLSLGLEKLLIDIFRSQDKRELKAVSGKDLSTILKSYLSTDQLIDLAEDLTLHISSSPWVQKDLQNKRVHNGEAISKEKI